MYVAGGGLLLPLFLLPGPCVVILSFLTVFICGFMCRIFTAQTWQAYYSVYNNTINDIKSIYFAIRFDSSTSPPRFPSFQYRRQSASFSHLLAWSGQFERFVSNRMWLFTALVDVRDEHEVLRHSLIPYHFKHINPNLCIHHTLFIVLIFAHVKYVGLYMSCISSCVFLTVHT